MNLEALLQDLGHGVITAFTRAEAMDRISKDGFDAAMLDVTLPDGDTYAIARMLIAAGVPFVFSTGRPIEEEEFGHIGILDKPYGANELTRCMESLAAKVADIRLKPCSVLPAR